jgi:hypothetical protein
VLQERAATTKDWNTSAVHEPLRDMLQTKGDIPRRLRALWALHVTGGLDAAALSALLDDEDEHLRAWAIQLLCERETPPQSTLAKFTSLAKEDPSPVVRLYLACALQRLPLDARWAIISPLLAHEEDATDANLPLMYWYALEPLVAAEKAKALALLPQIKIPQVRQFAARRAAAR